MFKFTIFLWIGLIAWKLPTSLTHPVGALQDTAIERTKFCLTVLEPLLVRFAQQQDQRSSSDGFIANETLDRMEMQPTQMYNQVLAMLSRIETQLANLPSSVRRIPENFIAIGSRFFYFENYNGETFDDANSKCRKMGGRLASMHNEEELANVMWHLYPTEDYWLATNDWAFEGHSVPSAGNKTAPFLNWGPGEPSEGCHTKSCIVLRDGFMYIADCNNMNRFICQAKNVY